MTSEQKIEIGKQLAQLLNVKPNKKDGRYETSWGTKTALGLAECAFRIIEEAVTEKQPAE